ncbi:aspartate dehydrogenase domain-containing protein isoform X2 [Eublepharis macularius]|uniref:Aspartate dehydrogenase domain-containing protein n=1 Tax=Eublepharis macularius TaxID=481883 RepID=A0AA97K1W1_EUBMA|nr:aspartate dehydrogenase domain-containing protein isoform X2 [Eublepharis macularius]
MSEGQSKRRVGIVGYGHLGQYLVRRLQDNGLQHGLELAFVWNRDANKLKGTVPVELQLGKLTDFLERRVDIIIEVAHPCIAQAHGESFLKAADFMALTVTMVKHPNSFRLGGHLGELAQGAQQKRTVLYDGPVRRLCPLAPNNVNTMAAACMAAPSLGFDGVKGCLIADPDLPDYHVVETEATGPGGFSVRTRRKNPAACGAVTGAATFTAFWSSLLVCQGHGGRVYLC